MRRLLVLIQLDAGESALVEDRNRCPILDGTADVVDVDYVAEDSGGVHILRFDRGAREPDEGGVRQSLADVMSVAIPALAGCLVELGVKPILAAMRLVRDDDDVSPVGQQREALFPSLRRELLDGGEDDAARGSIEQAAQIRPGCRPVLAFGGSGRGTD